MNVYPSVMVAPSVAKTWTSPVFQHFENNESVSRKYLTILESEVSKALFWEDCQRLRIKCQSKDVSNVTVWKMVTFMENAVFSQSQRRLAVRKLLLNPKGIQLVVSKAVSTARRRGLVMHYYSLDRPLARLPRDSLHHLNEEDRRGRLRSWGAASKALAGKTEPLCSHRSSSRAMLVLSRRRSSRCFHTTRRRIERKPYAYSLVPSIGIISMHANKINIFKWGRFFATLRNLVFKNQRKNAFQRLQH